MSLVRRSFFQGLLIGVVILAGILFSQRPAPQVQATGSNGLGNCGTNYVAKIEEEDAPFTFHSESNAITHVIVKAGSQNQGNACFTLTESNPTDGCYTATGLGTTNVTVERIGTGSDCKEISHVEFYDTVACTPTPTPTPTPTESPTPSPTATPTETPSPTPTATPSESPSPTPSPTESATPTPTPTPTDTPSPTPAPTNPPADNSSDTGSSGGEVGGASVSAKPEGQILGAMADTGVVEDVIMNMLGSLGGLMTGVGSVLYGKNKSR